MSNFKTDWANAIANLKDDLETVREVADEIDVHETDVACENMARVEKELAAVLKEAGWTFGRLLSDLQGEIDEHCGSHDDQNREACGGEYR